MEIGIMQGRLLPPIGDRFQCFPRGRWEEEFPLAQQAGLATIEWIYDLFGADDNPLASDAGIERMKKLSALHGVEVRSLCADYFMDKPFLRATDSEQSDLILTFRWLLQRCQNLALHHVVLPFVDISRIETPAEADQVCAIVRSLIPTLEETGVELHLETSLPPDEFAALLTRLSHPLVKANYDSGNSSSLGYDGRSEFKAYGERIGSVHIKDRIRGGGTVSLGSGDADFDTLFSLLHEIGYEREFILQVARAEPGREVEWARQNRAFVETKWLETAAARP